MTLSIDAYRIYSLYKKYKSVFAWSFFGWEAYLSIDAYIIQRLVKNNNALCYCVETFISYLHSEKIFILNDCLI